MNARHPLLFAALLASLPLAIAGCGNKGPLVMAEAPAPTEQPETPTGTVPVEIEPPQTLPADEPTGALADPTADDPTAADVTPETVDPAPADDIDGDPADAPASDPASDPPASDPRIPIDPATVPDSPPATGTADDDDG